MKFRDLFNEGNLTLTHQGKGGWGDGNKYSMHIGHDEFIHFTLEDRAYQILEAVRILINPPYKKFGTDSADAISLTFGKYVPETQSKHLLNNSKQPLAALHFKTNTLPYAAYIEEVKWNQDVNLIQPTVVQVYDAIQLLSQTKMQLGDQDEVVYLP